MTWRDDGDDRSPPPVRGAIEKPVRRREPRPVTPAEEPALTALESGSSKEQAEDDHVDVDDRPIDERRRRHLLAMMREREFSELGDSELDALKAIVARVQERPITDVSSKAIRWRDLEEIVEQIEALPERPPAESPPEEIEP